MGCRTVKKCQKNLSLTLLVCNCAGSLASGLAGCLALAAAALLCGLLQICLVDGLDVLHSVSLHFCSSKLFFYIIPYFACDCKRKRHFYFAFCIGSISYIE